MLKLSGSVGKGGSNKDVDVLVVQYALSQIKMKNTAKPGAAAKKLWDQTIDAVYSVSLAKAIGVFQAANKLKVTGVVKPNSDTSRLLAKNAPSVNHVYFDRHTIVSNIRRRKIIVSSKRAAADYLKKLAMPKKDVFALASIIVKAGSEGLQMSLVKGSYKVDRTTGKLQVTMQINLNVADTYSTGIFYFDLKKARKKIETIVADEATWKISGNNALRLESSKPLTVLKIGNYKASRTFIEYVGLSSDYRSSDMVRLITDAFRNMLETTGVSSETRRKGASQLLQMLAIERATLVSNFMDRLVGLGEVEADADGRNLPSLYAWELEFEIILRVLIGFKVQYILDPNSEREYLNVVIRLGVAKQSKKSSPITLGLDLKKLGKTLLDFKSVDFAIGAAAEFSQKIGPYTFKIEAASEMPKLDRPQLRLSWDDLLSLAGKQFKSDSKDISETGVEVALFIWDLGTVKFTILVDLSYENLFSEPTVETDWMAKVYGELRFFFSADSTAFDDWIYEGIRKLQPPTLPIP